MSTFSIPFRPLLLPRSSLSSQPQPRRRYKGTFTREKTLEALIQRKVAEATATCAGNGGSDGCKVAWDEVEEVSRAKAHLRRRIAESSADPLEPFCRDNPHADDCVVVYDD